MTTRSPNRSDFQNFKAWYPIAPRATNVCSCGALLGMEMFGKSPEIHLKKWAFTMFSPVNSGRTRQFHTEETWKSENNPQKNNWSIGVSVISSSRQGL